MNKSRRYLPLGATLLYIVGACIFFQIYHFLSTPASTEPATKTIYIYHGMTLRDATKVLTKKGLLCDTNKFILWAYLTGTASHIKAGEYRFDTPVSPREILNRLVNGRTVIHKVTVPEGYNIFQIAKLLSQKGLVDEQRFIEKAFDPEIISSLGVQAPSLEGYLYPDTYHLRWEMCEDGILRTMVNRFHNIYKDEFHKRAKEIGLSQKAVVTLASLIEKETSVPQERPLISAVLQKRLESGMRLECDPTVIYGLILHQHDTFEGNITKEDLNTKTPYNTYLIRGLPPGPIANPGESAIHAVLYPAKTEYLYFVSRNDGTHHFSKNWREHNRAVWKYQKTKK
jgi:UPF0755 protein